MSGKPDGWERATWEGAREAVLREGARMSLREKIAWLENAHRLAERLAQSDQGRETQPPERPQD